MTTGPIINLNGLHEVWTRTNEVKSCSTPVGVGLQMTRQEFARWTGLRITSTQGPSDHLEIQASPSELKHTTLAKTARGAGGWPPRSPHGRRHAGTRCGRSPRECSGCGSSCVSRTGPWTEGPWGVEDEGGKQRRPPRFPVSTRYL